MLLAGEVGGSFYCRSFRGYIALCHSAVYDEISAVDEAALVAGEEENGLGLLDGFAEAAGGEVDFAAVALGLVVTEPVLEERSTGKVSMWNIGIRGKAEKEKHTSTEQGTER